jgi:hypothetical protein
MNVVNPSRMSLNPPIMSTASLIPVSLHLLRPMGLTLPGGHSGVSPSYRQKMLTIKTLRSKEKGVSEKLIVFTQPDTARGQLLSAKSSSAMVPQGLCDWPSLLGGFVSQSTHACGDK